MKAFLSLTTTVLRLPLLVRRTLKGTRITFALLSWLRRRRMIALTRTGARRDSSNKSMKLFGWMDLFRVSSEVVLRGLLASQGPVPEEELSWCEAKPSQFHEHVHESMSEQQVHSLSCSMKMKSASKAVSLPTQGQLARPPLLCPLPVTVSSPHLQPRPWPSHSALLRTYPHTQPHDLVPSPPPQQ